MLEFETYFITIVVVRLMGSGIIRSRGLAEVGVAFLEQVCFCGGGL